MMQWVMYNVMSIWNNKYIWTRGMYNVDDKVSKKS